MSETQTYIDRLRVMRKDMFKAMDGLNAAGLNWKPTRRETNSAFILATHLLGSEKHWIHHVVDGREIQRDRDAEFRARGNDASSLRDPCDALARESEAILSRLASADWDATRETKNYGTISVRWCVLHLLEHYAEHVGQISLTRQVWEEQAKSIKPKAASAKRTVKAKKKIAKRKK
jgi:uncharacterized damage-inducible protein DinB